MQTKIQINEIKSRIEERGLKRRWIAGKLMVSEPLLSLFLKGERTLDPTKYDQLKQLLGL